MDVELAVAGVLSVALGVGHTLVGVRYALPTLTEERLSGTGLGPASMTRTMIRVTWFIVTIFALSTGGLLLTLAAAPDYDPRTVLLRWFAGMWLVAAVMSILVLRPDRRGMRNFMRLPVPLVWVVVAALLWAAST